MMITGEKHLDVQGWNMMLVAGTANDYEANSNIGTTPNIIHVNFARQANFMEQHASTTTFVGNNKKIVCQGAHFSILFVQLHFPMNDNTTNPLAWLHSCDNSFKE